MELGILHVLLVVVLVGNCHASEATVQLFSSSCCPDPDHFDINVTFPTNFEAGSEKGNKNGSSQITIADVVLKIYAFLETHFPLFGEDVPAAAAVKLLLEDVQLLVKFILLAKTVDKEVTYEEYTDKAIAKQAVVNLRSKINTVAELIKIIQDRNETASALEIKTEIALNECSELAHIFNDPDTILKKYPLLITPYVVSFAGICYSVAAFAASMDKGHYRERAYLSTCELHKLIESYKNITIKERQNRADGFWPWYCTLSFLYPTFCHTPLITDHIPDGSVKQINFPTGCTLDDTRNCYRGDVAIKYGKFFDDVLKVVTKGCEKYSLWSSKGNISKKY